MKKVYFFFDAGRFRIWLSDSPGDVFDVVTPNRLVDKLIEYSNQGYQLIPGEPDE